MVLSKNSIQLLLDEKKIKVQPSPEIKDASIKIHISNQFAAIGENYQTFQEYTLKPKEFILALSKERITLSEGLTGLYDGYTHLARKGVITHMGSMLVNPDTDGYITLEIFNASDKEIIIKEGDRVGQLMLLKIQ